jgi:hypothetical protein
MTVHGQIFSPALVRGVAVMCAVVFCTTAHTAQAGINIWTSLGPDGAAVSALAIDRATPGTLYAATNALAGLFKSTDGAATWGAANTGVPDAADVDALAIDPASRRTLYAGGGFGFPLTPTPTPGAVVGTGTAGGCTGAALDAALAGGGLVTFDYGPAPVTVDISTGTGTKTIGADTIIDCGGLVTLSGENNSVVFFGSAGVNFTVENLTIPNGGYSRSGGRYFHLNVVGVGPGGRIFNTSGAAALLRNTIVANNPSGGNGNCSGSITDGGHNLDDGTTCGFSTANGSVSNRDPLLDPAGLADNGGPTKTVALCTAGDIPAGCSAASPAIDTDDQAVCDAAPVSNRDQRGFVRPGAAQANRSIGAYEADAQATALNATADPSDRSCRDTTQKESVGWERNCTWAI